MSFLRHSLHEAIEQRREREQRARERRDFVHEHRNRAAKVAKLMATADEIALSRGLNPYRDAAAMAEMLDSFPPAGRLELAERAKVTPPSELTWEALVQGYRDRERGPHCTGLRDKTLEQLQRFGGDLQTLVDNASDAERLESWWAYARATEREVHFEIALRARKAAS